jgi:cation diffusion facilitator family transporter
MKILVGKMFGSMALVADGIHSLSDLLTDFLAWVSLRFSMKPPDEDHPFGHGKFDTLASMMISLVLVAVGGKIFLSGAMSLYNHNLSEIGVSVLLVALFSVFLKEYLYRVTKKVARKIHSPVLLANAEHHRSDALSSIAVLLGAMVGIMGFHHADALASIAVSLMIVNTGISIFTSALGELTEHSAGEEINLLIIESLKELPLVKGFHKIRTRRVGGEVFVDFHIQVDPRMTVKESHRITGILKGELQRDYSIPLNVLIHVEPFEEEH